MTDKLLFMVATFFWLGCVPVAPGTFGTLGAVLLHWAIAAHSPAALSVGLSWAILVAATALTGPLGGWAERRWGRSDPSAFVLDEVAGFFAATAVFPTGGSLTRIAFLFVAFRLFDIAKPPPIRRAERLTGGWGVVADDLVAGVAAGGVAHLAWLLASAL